MRRKYFSYQVFLLSMSLMTFGIFTNPIKAMHTRSSVNSDIATPKDDLYKKIKIFGDEQKIEPIDAKVDRVWKAIPGYNGLGVNIEASYKKMKKSGNFDERLVVYEEITPNVHLEDLASEPIYRGNPQKTMVALLINVAWGNEYIPEILKTLNDLQSKVTFFFDGSWVKKNPDLAMLIKEGGHEIGNHAYSHPDLKQRSKADTIVELKKTNDVIKETLGIKPKWFAPPSGSFNQITIQVADQFDMKTILWTVDTVDWKKPSTSEMVSRVVSKVGNGSMVLMHPTKPVAEGLENMIMEIKAKGYELGTVSDLMSEKRIESQSTSNKKR